MEQAIKKLNSLVKETADEILGKEKTYLDALDVVKQDRYSNSQNDLQIQFLNAVETYIYKQAVERSIL